LVFVLCFGAVLVALSLHRWPRPRPARIDLAEVQQRVEALRQEVEQAGRASGVTQGGRSAAAG
jgi:hypothetical protein